MAVIMTEPATGASSGEMTYYSIPIEKVSDLGDGTVEVWGRATDGSLDSDLQIVDPEWSEKALREWFETGANIRVQHQAGRDPAGKGIEVDGHYVRARIVEPVAVKLVKAGVLQDYSVGIMNPDVRSNRDPALRHLDPRGKAVKGIITGRPDGMSKIGELSLVDRGSNFGTKFSLVKAAADGTAAWVGTLTAPDDVLTKITRPPRSHKTVSVDLPKNMRLRVTPADLAKVQTHAKLEALRGKLAREEAAKAAVPQAAKRDFDPDVGGGVDRDKLKAGDFVFPKTRDFPIVTAGDVSDAVHDWGRYKGGESFATFKKRLTALAKRKGFESSLPEKWKKDKKSSGAAKASKPDKKVTRDIERAETDQAKDPDAKTDSADRKVTRDLKDAARDQARDGKGKKGKGKASKTARPSAAKKKKKKGKKGGKAKVLCGGCGARQSAKHANCTECGNTLDGAMAITKNHDFTCLGCGKTLDKGERFCPGCGRENPGYLPEADRKIPGNKTAKTTARKTAAVAKGGKRKKGKGRSPADGVEGQHTAPLPPHREPDSPATEAFERDAAIKTQMDTALRHKNAGAPPDLGVLHDLTCPAYHPHEVTKAIPGASFAGIDTAMWEGAALTAASAGGADPQAMLSAWENAAALSRHAVTLKTADPQMLQDLRLEHHAAFLSANRKRLGLTRRDIAKTFRDAAPGPVTAPTPGHPAPGDYRRPYLSAGHAADSPQHDGPRAFPVPQGQPVSTDYTRGYLADGHAADSPSNGDRGLPAAPSRPGKPGRVFYANTARDNTRQALSAMHDRLSRLFPDICLMSPDLAHVQKPAPPVPEAVGGPVPHKGKNAKAGKKAAKAAKAKAREAAKAKAAKARKAAKATAGEKAIRAAVKAATRDLGKRQDRMGKTIRRQRKALDAIASARDTTSAPFRGAGVAKTASATPAGPLTVAGIAELHQASELQRLEHAWRNSYNPAERVTAYKAWESMLAKAANPGPPTSDHPTT